MDVEVQEKAGCTILVSLRSLESDDRRVLVIFDSPANSPKDNKKDNNSVPDSG